MVIEDVQLIITYNNSVVLIYPYCFPKRLKWMLFTPMVDDKEWGKFLYSQIIWKHTLDSAYLFFKFKTLLVKIEF